MFTFGPNGYEVSTDGDKRFSALVAKMPDGRTLEMHYQCCVKGYDPGGTNWRLGKGKPPLNKDVDLWQAYLQLWRVWVSHNLTLFEELRENALKCGGVLSDKYARTPINQARALAHLLNENKSIF